MITIKNGIILKGLDLVPIKEDIVIDDGKIIKIAENLNEGKIIDATGCIVSPSFLNAHTHIGDSIIKDMGYGLSLDEMVKPPNGVKHVALANADDNVVIEEMKNSMWDMVKSGTTHFIDYREGGIKGIKLLKEASKDIPIKPIILGRDDSFYGDDLSEVKKAISKILKIADGIALSGFGEISDEVANLITSECEKNNKISSIHVAENYDNQVSSVDRFNKTEIERAINSKFQQVVHGTNPLKNDIQLIADSKTNLVVCPRANANLSVGVAPLYDMLSLGIKPLLGSDNIMLNSPNILRELEFTMKINSVYYKHYICDKDLLSLATTNVNLNNINKIVSKSIIEQGYNAELVIFKQLSNNPYLSIINRNETKHIKYIVNKNIINI